MPRTITDPSTPPRTPPPRPSPITESDLDALVSAALTDAEIDALIRATAPKRLELHCSDGADLPKRFGARVRALAGGYSDVRGHATTRYVEIPDTVSGRQLASEIVRRYRTKTILWRDANTDVWFKDCFTMSDCSDALDARLQSAMISPAVRQRAQQKILADRKAAQRAVEAPARALLASLRNAIACAERWPGAVDIDAVRSMLDNAVDAFVAAYGYAPKAD